MAGSKDVLSDPRTALARRELSSLSREKTIVLALLIQLFVASFSSFLVVGLTSLYDPGSVASDDIVVGVSGDQRDALEEAAARQDGIRVRTYRTRATALAAFQAGDRDDRVDAVVHASTFDGRIDAEVTAPQSSIRTTVVVQQVRTLLEAVERNERAVRESHLTREVVPLPQEVPASPYFGFTYTVLIPLLLFLPPFISGSVAVDSITEEIERDTLELLRVSPVSLVEIVDGKAAAMILLAPAQALLWIGLLAWNGIAVSNVLTLLVAVTAIAALVVSIGLGLGVQTAQRRQAQLLYSVLVIFVFGLAVFLPEHPTTTVAKLAVDSASVLSYAHVGGYVVLAVVGYALLRSVVGRVDAENL
ncbi:ABC transporter permease [Haloarculaceae archaeon H-GB2-1]|nr:ABC transporter permease [Haloarculaceae archaeon H-GB1-1]MEA5386374.1 ABC transporter permease [Haloarculaceae archaeon H-GB11]MEA5407882.1 ABC transporter permease [Haloarculaceae archaeon H-GB2-1]